MSGVARAAAGGNNPLPPAYTTAQQVGFGFFGVGVAALIALGVVMQMGKIQTNLAGRFGIMAGPASFATIGAALVFFCRPSAPPLPPARPLVMLHRPLNNETLCLGTNQAPIVIASGNTITGSDNATVKDLSNLAEGIETWGMPYRLVLETFQDKERTAPPAYINDLLKALGKAKPGSEIIVGDGSDSPANCAAIFAFLDRARDTQSDLGCVSTTAESTPRWDIAVYTDDREMLAEMNQLHDISYVPQQWPRRIRFYKPSPNHTNISFSSEDIRSYANAMWKAMRAPGNSVLNGGPGMVAAAQPYDERPNFGVTTVASASAASAASSAAKIPLVDQLGLLWAHCTSYKWFGHIKSTQEQILQQLRDPAGKLKNQECALLIAALYDGEIVGALSIYRDSLIKFFRSKAIDQNAVMAMLLPLGPNPGRIPDTALSPDNFSHFNALT